MILKDLVHLIMILSFWWFIVYMFKGKVNPYDWTLNGKVCYLIVVFCSISSVSDNDK
jgi:hypothetical protein